MTGASKILTVSYGTFSCTLEGFDDPFNTMKAIAEYFRDLAAEDRYFGAEPPQPDAAMLHKIAEREIQRRVEAKIEANGVTLRAGPQSDIMARLGANADEPEAPRPVVRMPAAPDTRSAPVAAPTLAPAPTDTDSTTTSVAEKLSRLRNAAAPQAATSLYMGTAAYDADDAVTDFAATDDHTDNAATKVSEASTQIDDDMAYEDLAYDDGAETRAVEATQDHADSDAGEDDGFAIADLAVLDGADADDMIAATQDLSQDEMPAAAVQIVPQTDDEFEDDGADAMIAALSRHDAPTTASEPIAPQADEPSAVAADDTALLAALGQLIDPEDDDFEDEPSVEVIADTMEADDSLTDIAPLPEAETVTVIMASEETLVVETEMDEATAPQAQADVAKEDTTEAEPDLADEPTPAAAPIAAAMPQAAPGPVRPVRPVRPARAETTDARPAAFAETPAPMAADPATTEPVSLEKLQRARARVIKIRRSDALAADAGSAPAPAKVDAAPARISPRRPVLSDEAEAALAAELAALEADTPDAASETTAAPSRSDLRTALAPAGDEAVSRLMDEASTQMDGADTKRRQSAIAHLKAAVAATMAERKATGNTLLGDTKLRIDAYRNDLAAVVRPNAGTGASVPAERPAPLVLVSEQRIDRPAATTHVQPRRVGGGMATAAATAAAHDFDEDDLEDDEDDGMTGANIFGATDGFADFADRLGADELPRLLEAAAAYIACVEGRDSFTRPQLMRHLSATDTEFAREDGLRSFGTLLRNGVIEKTRRGQFALSESSALLAEARKIAG